MDHVTEPTGDATQWICLACGQANPMHRSDCSYCGHPRDGGDGARPPRIVHPARVARILALYASPPGYRERRAPGDPEGPYTAWFDGGTIRDVTGSTEVRFADGTRLWTGPFDHLNLEIEFPDGSRVTVRQERPPSS